MFVNVPIPDKDYKVIVRCITYNQSKYICDALNGFAIQETNFPFICIVVDDASKDGNQDVIKRYANENCDMSKAEISEDDVSKYIRVPHKTNGNCFFLFCFLNVNLFGKPEKQEIYKPYRAICEYEAICEGDDYWTDSQKIQKQVDVMTSDQSVGFVYTGFSTVDENGEPRMYPWCEERMERSCSGDIFEKLIDHNMVLTLTICFRKTLYDKYLEFLKKYSVSIDYFLFLVLAGLSKGIYIDEKMGCYRINSNGLVQSSRERVNALCNKALIVSSKIYLNGEFFERSFKEDLKIRKAIVTKFLRLVKSNVMTKSEFFKIVSSSFKMICMLCVVFVEMLKKKLL